MTPLGPTVWARSITAGLNPEAYFRRRAEHPDPFVLAFPGLGAVHFLATSEGCQQLLATPRDALRAPTPNPIEPIVGPSSVILTSGEQHHRQRRVLASTIHGAQLSSHADAMAEAVRTEVDTWRPGDRIRLHRTTQSITLRIIIEAVLGTDADRGGECAEVVKALMNTNTAALLLVPALRKSFAGIGPWARLGRLRAQFQELLSEQLESGRGCPHSAAVANQLQREGTLDDDDLEQQVRTMMIAGHDTTAAALAWALYHVHRDAEVRARLDEELRSAPDPDQLPRLPYLSAVIKETLRMHPAVPIVLRKLVEPRTIGGLELNAGDVAGIAIPAIHFNSDLWPEPYRFNPDRFLDHNPTPFEYLPFGGGHRRCLGAAFATYEMAVAIGTMLRKARLTMRGRAHPHSLPRSIPRGIAVVPHRDVRLLVSAVS